ncbi:hypothetical protein RND71_033658 [Anisodus tanguticus]|uniref:RRM domain-containing protein n=1 Tax=Anisodus tanguticus TaxID=243964 RepID=A0AAE1V3F3_9SOLA|nr:hypothetical protein RND71_033658 [Anisodus tanguticus]
MPMINVSKEKGRTPWEIRPGADSIHVSSDASLFSSSVPVLLHEKLTLSDGKHGHQSVDDASPSLKKINPDVEVDELLDDGENRAIGSFLPDDEDELLAGIMDGFDPSRFPNHTDDLEEYDLFGSGGGLELDSDGQEHLNLGISRVSLADPLGSNGAAIYGVLNGAGAVTGEHPLGEHPSRTLFVRNINSNVEDSELRTLFEQYGDVRTLYTACKHRGFVMISYFDIRAARTAMRALQNKPLRRRKLDIHFSIPKDNPSDKDVNQGTLVVFNLDPSVSNDDLRQIFGAYGEIKEIRETPHKRHHKFIEYYDVRAAEAALRSLNRSDIAGKRIKLEPSRPGGARRNIVLQSNQEPEQDDSLTFRHPLGSSIGNFSPGNWPQFGSPIEHGSTQSPGTSPGFTSLSPTIGNNLHGLASILHPRASSTLRVAPIGEDRTMSGHADFPNGSNHGSPFPQSHSFPEPKIQFGGTVSSLGASNINGSAVETLSGPQFLWGSPKLHPQQSNSPSWKTQSLANAFTFSGQGDRFSLSNHQKPFLNSSQHHQHHLHHVGSAPSGFPFDRHFGFYPDSSILSPGFRGMGIAPRDGSLMVNYGARTTMNAGVAVPGNMSDNGSPGFGMMSSQRPGPLFLGNGHFPGHAASSFEGLTERSRTRRVDNNNGNQMDNKKLFQLDLDKIRSGEDTRTTLMIKNIPNKYTSKMLLAAIDEQHKGTFDFLYLPIDFKNKCNVGYAFINMLSPSLIILFYEAFNGKKWEKFNSEKVAALAYARIQGKTALVAHFQNSSLMNEDKRCRPILFHSESSELGDQVVQEHLSSGCLHIQVCQSNESDFLESQGSPPEEDPVDKLENS